MNLELNLLIQLGDIDYRINEINKLLGDLPYKVESQQNTIHNLTEENESKSQLLSELERGTGSMQIEIDNTNDKLGKYKKQLYLVTTNREYDALLTEIDHANETLLNLKVKLDSQKKEKDSLAELIKSNEIKLKETTVLLQENLEELKETQSSTEKELSKLENLRKTIEKKIEHKYLNLYNKLKDGRIGVGITTMNRNACGACYNLLPPQTAIEVKRGENVITCHSCGVLLFWESLDN